MRLDFLREAPECSVILEIQIPLVTLIESKSLEPAKELKKLGPVTVAPPGWSLSEDCNHILNKEGTPVLSLEYLQGELFLGNNVVKTISLAA